VLVLVVVLGRCRPPFIHPFEDEDDDEYEHDHRKASP